MNKSKLKTYSGTNALSILNAGQSENTHGCKPVHVAMFSGGANLRPFAAGSTGIVQNHLNIKSAIFF